VVVLQKMSSDVPEGLDVLAIVPFCYPAQAVGKRQKRRKPLSEEAQRGRF